MYSAANYTGAHPPLIGFALDGPAIYGRYLSTSALGETVPLDKCGGHVHDNLDYHYHSQVGGCSAMLVWGAGMGCRYGMMANGWKVWLIPSGRMGAGAAVQHVVQRYRMWCCQDVLHYCSFASCRTGWFG